MNNTNQKRKRINETDIKNQIKDYLYLRGWFNFPLTAGMGSYPGLPDRIAVKNGRVLFIEVKTAKGKQSPKQEEFEDRIKEAGGEYYVVRGIDDIQKIIEKNR